MVGTKTPKLKQFTGASYLRQRLVYATLSATPIRVSRIRESDSSKPGLSASEVCFVRLLDKVSAGATIQINETGTTLTYRPGLLVGSVEKLSHDCHISRGISYYLQPILLLAPFCKHAVHLSLTGATHHEADASIDTVSDVTIPLVRRALAKSGVSPQLSVRRRSVGAPGGLVDLRCDVLGASGVPALDLYTSGPVKRVRGVAYGNRVSPAHVSALVDGARSILNSFSPDVYVHTDHCNEARCGAGFGLSLVATAASGEVLGADWAVGGRPDVKPVDVARAAANMLLEEVENGGTVDAGHVPMAVALAAVSQPDLSRIRAGRLSEAAVAALRDLDAFFGVRFSVRVLGGAVTEVANDDGSSSDESSEEEEEDDKDQGPKGPRASGKGDDGHGVVLSCIGVGLTNTARKRF